MRISLIVAMGPKREIGIHNDIPWKLSADLKNFKKLTLGHTLLMGRRTFESIGKALPGRKTIILSRNLDYKIETCSIASSLEEAFDIAREDGESELFISGGSHIYKQALPFVDRFYFSFVDYHKEADTYFPEYSLKNWKQRICESYPSTGAEPSWTYEVWDKGTSGN